MTNTQTIKILCVEDNPGDATIIQRTLARAGYDTTVVHSGMESLEIRSREKFDVILIDNLLPDITGLNILEGLLKDDPNFPAIMITGKGDEQTAVSAMKLGAKDYVIKDISSNFPDMLPAVVERVYNQYVMVREKESAEKAAKNREAILNAVAQMAEQLLKSPQWRINLDDILAQLCLAANASRVYIVENEMNHEGQIVIRSYQEWHLEMFQPSGLERSGRSFESLGLDICIPALKLGQPVFGVNKGSSQDNNQYNGQRSGSFVLMPIFADSDWWGFIGFEDENEVRVWETVEIEALGMAANILGAALQRQITEKTLYQAQKMESIGLLAGGIAHDFNNLLTGILAQSSISLYKLPAESTARGHISKTIQIAEQAADLVRQLLGYSGKGQYETHAIDLNELIGENSGLFEMISRAKATMTLRLEPNLATIEVDPSQIQQVLMNLVINATESIDLTGGEVLISTETVEFFEPYLCIGNNRLQPGSYVCLEVRDSGSGMKPETMTHIFDPFYSTKSTGRGLGLSATLGIVKAHGGGVQVESEWQKGSQFQVYLPTSAKKTKTQRLIPNFEGEIEALILVVDDEELVLAPVKDGLELLGADVMIADSGQQGIDIYRKYHKNIDLVILDMTMPGLDGRETYLRMKAINPGLRVILSSGYSERETIQKFEQDEIISFLRKPYRFENLFSEVKMALKNIRHFELT